MLHVELYDLPLKPVVAHPQTPHCHGQRKPPGTRAAGIEIEHAVLLAHHGSMRMASDDCMHSGRERIQVEFVEVMQDIQEFVTGLNDL